jgi:hypothetical protein
VQQPLPPTERLLYSFASEQDLALWNVFTDKDFGGQSTAELSPSRDETVRGRFVSH